MLKFCKENKITSIFICIYIFLFSTAKELEIRFFAILFDMY